MSNYAPILPRDKGDAPLQAYPSPKKALAVYASENSSASSVVSLTHDTTAVEFAAVTVPAVIRWIPVGETASATGGTFVAASVLSDATGANFDHVVPIHTLRRFVVPIERSGSSPSVQGVNQELGLYQRVAFKSIGIGSVLLTEF